jgi:hypothetical protein
MTSGQIMCGSQVMGQLTWEILGAPMHDVGAFSEGLGVKALA